HPHQIPISPRASPPRPLLSLSSRSAVPRRALLSRTARVSRAKEDASMDRRSFLALTLAGAAARPRLAAAQAKRKMAMIMPGPIQDADFNAVGYLALQQVAKTYDLQVSHSESVVVADAERITREYVTAGYERVANHGGQFIPIMHKLATQLSNAPWIQEASGRLPNLPKNAWNIGRKFLQGFYVLGALGALATKSNKVGMVCGVRLPDVITSVNSVAQALRDVNPQAH